MRLVKYGLVAGGGLLAAGLVLFGLLGLGGAAQAQTPPDKDSLHSRYEQLLAQRLGVTVEQLQTAQKGARDQMIDEAVSRGLLTQEQATALKSREVRGAPFLGRIGRGAHAVIGNVIEAAAGVLGMSADDVKAGLRDGQSLNQMAQTKGISRDALKSGLESRLRAEIQDALAKGSITQEQATRLLNGLSQHLDRIIDANREGVRERLEQRGMGPRMR